MFRLKISTFFVLLQLCTSSILYGSEQADRKNTAEKSNNISSTQTKSKERKKVKESSQKIDKTAGMNSINARFADLNFISQSHAFIRGINIALKSLVAYKKIYISNSKIIKLSKDILYTALQRFVSYCKIKGKMKTDHEFIEIMLGEYLSVKSDELPIVDENIDHKNGQPVYAYLLRMSAQLLNTSPKELIASIYNDINKTDKINTKLAFFLNNIYLSLIYKYANKDSSDAQCNQLFLTIINTAPIKEHNLFASKDFGKVTPLEYLTFFNCKDELIAILNQHRVDCHTPINSDEYSPLMIAALIGNQQVLFSIIEHSKKSVKNKQDIDAIALKYVLQGLKELSSDNNEKNAQIKLAYNNIIEQLRLNCTTGKKVNSSAGHQSQPTLNEDTDVLKKSKTAKAKKNQDNPISSHSSELKQAVEMQSDKILSLSDNPSVFKEKFNINDPGYKKRFDWDNYHLLQNLAKIIFEFCLLIDELNYNAQSLVEKIHIDMLYGSILRLIALCKQYNISNPHDFKEIFFGRYENIESSDLLPSLDIVKEEYGHSDFTYIFNLAKSLLSFNSKEDLLKKVYKDLENSSFNLNLKKINTLFVPLMMNCIDVLNGSSSGSSFTIDFKKVLFDACNNAKDDLDNFYKEDFHGFTPLSYLAFLDDDLEMNLTIQYINDKLKIKCDVADSQGRTPLMFAALAGNTKTVLALMKRCSNYNVTDKNGKTALDYAILGLENLKKGNDNQYARDCYEFIIKMLSAKKSGAQTTQQSTDVKIKNENKHAQEQITLNATDSEQITPLTDKSDTQTEDTKEKNELTTNNFDLFMRAINEGDQKIVRELIDKGVDINNCDRTGKTPLICADIAVMNCKKEKNCSQEICKHVQIRSLLIERGAHVNKRLNKEGRRPIFVAISSIEQTNDESIFELLLKWDANLNVKYKGKSPYEFAHNLLSKKYNSKLHYVAQSLANIRNFHSNDLEIDQFAKNHLKKRVMQQWRDFTCKQKNKTEQAIEFAQKRLTNRVFNSLRQICFDQRDQNICMLDQAKKTNIDHMQHRFFNKWHKIYDQNLAKHKENQAKADQFREKQLLKKMMHTWKLHTYHINKLKQAKDFADKHLLKKAFQGLKQNSELVAQADNFNKQRLLQYSLNKWDEAFSTIARKNKLNGIKADKFKQQVEVARTQGLKSTIFAQWKKRLFMQAKAYRKTCEQLHKESFYTHQQLKASQIDCNQMNIFNAELQKRFEQLKQEMARQKNENIQSEQKQRAENSALQAQLMGAQNNNNITIQELQKKLEQLQQHNNALEKEEAMRLRQQSEDEQKKKAEQQNDPEFVERLARAKQIFNEHVQHFGKLKAGEFITHDGYTFQFEDKHIYNLAEGKINALEWLINHCKDLKSFYVIKLGNWKWDWGYKPEVLDLIACPVCRKSCKLEASNEPHNPLLNAPDYFAWTIREADNIKVS